MLEALKSGHPYAADVLCLEQLDKLAGPKVSFIVEPLKVVAPKYQGILAMKSGMPY